MALPTPEYVNTWLGQQFEADCINRKKIKTLNKYNKLSIKTKIKRLKDNLKRNIKGNNITHPIIIQIFSNVCFISTY